MKKLLTTLLAANIMASCQPKQQPMESNQPPKFEYVSGIRTSMPTFSDENPNSLNAYMIARGWNTATAKLGHIQKNYTHEKSFFIPEKSISWADSVQVYAVDSLGQSSDTITLYQCNNDAKWDPEKCQERIKKHTPHWGGF